MDSGCHDVDNGISGTGIRIPPQWILDSKRSVFQDSGFLYLDSGFQREGFWIPLSTIFWIPDSTWKSFLDSGFRVYLTWGELFLNSSVVFGSFMRAHTQAMNEYCGGEMLTEVTVDGNCGP